MNGQVGVKPGRHVPPAEVVQVHKQIASEASQDEEPRRSLQGHAEAEASLVSAVGGEQQGEAGEGQEDHRGEQADVQHAVDQCHGPKVEGHLREEQVQAQHHDEGHDLGEDQQEQNCQTDTTNPDVVAMACNHR